MTHAPLRLLLRQLHRGRAAPPEPGVSDAELLDRFVRARDEAAFELLVRRHGAMVHGVCRRVLRDAHAAEDAFQATFLMLVRKAASVGRREALAGWLYRVASRVAMRARGRRGPLVASDLPEPAAEAPDDLLWRDVRPVLDEEVGRLPEKYRLPVVLCYLGGQTTDQAARQMGVPRGTVLSRLAWARERLRARLTLRGVTLSAAALGALLASEAAAAAGAIRAAIRIALFFASGQSAAASPGAVILMEGVLRDMVMNKVKNGLLVVVGIAVLGLGAALWASRPATAEPGDRKRDDGPRAGAPAEPKGGARAAEPARPVGVWERRVEAEHGSVQITIRADADRITAIYEATEDGQKMTATLEAEYTFSRDHVLYGIITGAELSLTGAKPEDRRDLDEMSGLLLDHTFSARYRLDDNVLTVKDVKFGDADLRDKDNGSKEWQAMLLALRGRYKKKDMGKDDRAP